MVMARLHLICGNCGCPDEWEWEQRRIDMATTRAIIDGMKIITGKMTEEELDGYEINPAHDQIFCGEYDPTRMSEEEIATLEKLGWFEDEDAWSIFT